MGIAAKTFRGGIHPLHHQHHGKNLTDHKPIEAAPVPGVVVIPMAQNIGAPAKVCVQVGDVVAMGQKIGEAGGFVSVPVHASVSGRVAAIEPRPCASGAKAMCVVIENDGLDTRWPGLPGPVSLDELEPEQICQRIMEAGIVGMGGAAFPTHVKLKVPEGKHVDTLLINGAECEPFLTADHRLMVERPMEVVLGVRALMKALQVTRAYIGIEVNKPDAIDTMQKAVRDVPGVEVTPLKVKYPQGGEKQLISAILGREVPSGGLPMEAGVVVQNVGSAGAIGRMLSDGMPLVERVVSITGYGVKEPRNLSCRIGTSFEFLIEHCGGFTGEPGKVISGGPMMGIAQYDLGVPVVKGTSGILVLPEEKADGEEGPCIRCGRCVEACPIHLMPLMLSAYQQAGNIDMCESYHALDCMECGSCSYVCPSKRYLVQAIRTAKRQIIANRKKAEGGRG